MRRVGGEALTLLGVASYALYSVLVRRTPAGLDSAVFLAAAALAGLAVLLPFAALEWAAGQRPAMNRDLLAAVLYAGLAMSLLGYWLWNQCVATLGPALTGVSLHLVPVFTPLLAFALLGERLAAYHGAGVVLILAGVALATPRRPLRTNTQDATPVLAVTPENR